MKLKLPLYLLCLLLCNLCQAQIKMKKGRLLAPHKAIVHTLNDKHVGWLYAATDSTVILTQSLDLDKGILRALLFQTNSHLKSEELKIIPAKDIWKIRLRMKNYFPLGVAQGAAGGAALGMIIGANLASEFDGSMGRGMLVGVQYFTPMGGVLGIPVGLIDNYKAVPQCNEEVYKNHYPMIAKRALKHSTSLAFSGNH
ncbi:MAG: hypothetical protein AAGG75_15965 [Bacteroidota bacterium]